MAWQWSKYNPKDLARYVNGNVANSVRLAENRHDLAQKSEGRRQLLEAIYNALVNRDKKVGYALEKYHPSEAIQPIRTPVEILDTPSEGTCLDLAVLFCGICLGKELLPLLIVLENHALVAVSLTHSLQEWDAYDRQERDFFRDGEPLTDADQLRELIDSDTYLALECTGFAQSESLSESEIEGVGRINGFLPFDRAVAAGREQLDHQALRFALDIAVAHYSWRIEPVNIPEKTIEQGLSQVNEEISFINLQLQRLAREQGVEKQSISYPVDPPPPNLDFPSLAANLSSREETVNRLIEIFNNHTWLAIHGSKYCGKTHLAVLLAQKLLAQGLGSRYACIQLSVQTDEQMIEQACEELDKVCRALVKPPPQINYSDWYRQSCKQLGNQAIIVLDDLPRFLRNDQLWKRLIPLAKACQAHGVLLLSTSPYPLPSGFPSFLGTQLLYTIESPSFKDSEAAEILQAYGAPLSIVTSESVMEYINALAKRHPLRLEAIAQYLQQQNWQFTVETLKELFKGKGEQEAELNDDIAYVIRTTIKHEQSRQLLYRLNLILGDFSEDDMEVVASVAPIVDSPHECLDRLRGLWVQRDANKRLLVSPLVKVLGNTNLSLEAWKVCHLRLGEQILGRHQLTPQDVMRVLIHFRNAEVFDRAGLMLITALNEINSVDVPVDHVGLIYVWSDRQLPNQMNLGIRLYLRGLQVAVRHNYNRDISYLVEDLDVLLKQASETEAWAVLGVTTITNSVLSLNDPMRANYYLLTALRFLPQTLLLDGSELVVPDEVHLELLIWANIRGITTVDHLRDWIGTVEQLTVEQRQRVFTAPPAELGCLTVSEKLSLTEVDKPENEQQWHTVLATLEELADRALNLGLDLLGACAVRTKIVVLAEHCHDIDSAVSAAQAAILQDSDDPRIQLLIRGYVGQRYVYVNRDCEALAWLRSALNHNTSAYPRLRMLALLYASRAAGSQDAQAAIQYAQQAVSLAQTSEAISDVDLVKALGELAIAKWLAGDLSNVSDVFEPWEQAGEQLFSCKPDTSTNSVVRSNTSNAATHYTQQLRSLAEISEAISHSDIVAFNELAIPQALFGDSSNTFALGGSTNERLLDGEGKEIDEWMSLFVMYAHISGYFMCIASTKHPPTETKDGEPYAAPRRGIFLTHNPQRAEYYNSSRDSLLATQLVMFAEAISNDEQATAWTVRGREILAESNQQPMALPMLNIYSIPGLLLDNRYAEAFDLALETGGILVTIKQQPLSGREPLQSDIDVEGILGPKPSNLWNQAEDIAATMGLLPIAFRLSTLAICQPELAYVQLVEIATKCRHTSEISVAPQLWTTAAELLEQIYLREASQKELIQRSNAFSGTGASVLWAIGYLCSSFQKDFTLQNSLRAHLYITHSVYNLFRKTPIIYRRIVLPFISTYWTTTFDKMRFRFNSPQLIERELSEAQNIPEERRAQTILRTVAYGLGVSPPSEFEQWL